ncbi:MAG: nitrilase-related carbon-nitrogen hydrolase [Candidatus Dormibacteria bacterium]
MSSESPRRRLALAQCAPVLGDLGRNLEMHHRLATDAVARGADMCVFPELSLTGYLLKDLVPDLALSLDDPRLDPLMEMSRHVDLVFGAVVRSDDFRHYNAAIHLSAGAVRQVHRKVYLPTYGMFDEQRYFAPGDRVRVIDDHGFRVGMLVCEDLWHLSTPYLMFVQGVSLLLCLSASPGRGVLADPDAGDMPGSLRSWRALCRTVAEYTVSYVAYCNRVGYEDGVNFWGGSSLHGPDGRLVASAGEAEEVLVVEVDPREVERRRLHTPLLRDEKVELTLRELERHLSETTDGPY